VKHIMRLHTQPFEMIKSGEKTIELRLYDEKRKSICAGDEIEFVHSLDDTKRLYCQVVRIHVFPSFKELYDALPLLQCGYTANDVAAASYTDMEKYYTVEQQQAYGVVGIELAIKK